jgi:hypothetical protein
MPSRLSRAALVATLVVVASCEKPKPPVPPAGPAERVVVVHGKDFSFDAPNDIEPGLVTFRFINDGPSLHHMQLIRFDNGKTLVDLQEAMKKKPGPFPKWVTFAGGPNATDSGTESNATETLLAGDYAIICMIDVPDHVPHFMKGMAHALHVGPAGGTPTVAAPAKTAAPAGAKAAAPAPAPALAPAPAPALKPADLTVTLSSYQFTLSDSVRAGTRTIDVIVTGDQPHEMAIFKLHPGVTVESFLQWGSSYSGPLPATAMGGTAAANAGVLDRITVDFTPGEYVLMCFVIDPVDGKPHAMRGMVKTFTVK